MHPDTATPRRSTPTLRHHPRAAPAATDSAPGRSATQPDENGLSVFAAPDAATHRHLYGHTSRLALRTRSLHAAKIVGADASSTLADLAADVTEAGARIGDLGCGRGTSSVRLAARLRPARLTLVDRSTALLHTAVERVRQAGDAASVAAVCADFHYLPLRTGSLDLAVAAFCLYHSAAPEQVLAQVAATLAPDGPRTAGHALLATKSTSSYVELDELMAATGLDPDALTRPSLYATLHSANIATVAHSALDVLDVHHEQHVFRFTGHDHLAAYLSTTPKYVLPAALDGDQEALARELAHRGAPREVTMTSTVTYLLARAGA